MEVNSKSRYKVLMYALTAANVGSLLAASSLLITLNPEDRISILRGSSLTLLGVVHFMSMFELLNVLALGTAGGVRLRKHYRLSCGDVLDINNKAVSGVQALQCWAAGARVCAYSCSRDLLHTSHYLSDAYAWFGAAYFFYDIWSMYTVYVYYKTKQEYFPPERAGDDGGAPPDAPPRPTFWQYLRYEPMILFHHVFIGGFGFLVIVYLRGSLGDCVFGVVYMMEASTPLVSLRGILSRLKLKQSRLYVANGLAMLLTFLVCRVLSLPYVMLMYSRAVRLPYLQAAASLPTGCKVSIALLMVPQLYWFYLMSLGAVKVFLPRKGKHSTPAAVQGREAGDAGAKEKSS